MTKRIVVTGIGATTPLGGTARETWQNLLAGVSGARTLEYEWVAKHQLPVTFAAQAAVPSADVLERVETKRLDPSSQFALIAGREAWQDAGAPEVDPERLASTGPPASAVCGRSSTRTTRCASAVRAGCCP